MSETRRFPRARRWVRIALALTAVGLVGGVAYLTSSANGWKRLTTDSSRAASAAWRMSADAATTAKVKMALAMSRSVEAFPIDVDSHRGTVTLTGKVPSLESEAAALRIAGDTLGVGAVVDRLEVTSESQPTPDELRARLEDAEIRCMLYQRFLRTPGLSASGLDVLVRDRVVTLTGTVEDVLMSRRAEDIAASAAKVRSIVNRITIVDSFPRVAAVPVPDEEVSVRVREELAGTGALGVDGIEIEVRSGIVRLTGGVRSEAERQLAELLAGSVEGAVAVVNALTVTEDLR